MNKSATIFISLLAGTAAVAETRELGSHEHGVSTLDIAVEGTNIAMTLSAPGADIVRFEYAPETDADKTAVESAIAALSDPLTLFAPPASAECSIVSAKAELILEDGHDDHEHGHDDHDDHGAKEEEHDHADDHDHAHDDAHDHDEDHAEKADAGHSEFEAQYMLNCEAPEELSQLQFAYFDSFPNAEEIRVQIVSASGAQAFAVTDQAPSLTLPELF